MSWKLGNTLHALEGRPSGLLRINAARISTAMVMGPLLAGFRESVSRRSGRAFLPTRATWTSWNVASTPGSAWAKVFRKTWWQYHSAGRSPWLSSVHPTTSSATPCPDTRPTLVNQNCIRFRFSGSGAIYKWEFDVDSRRVEYEVSGGLTISDSLYAAGCRTRRYWTGVHLRYACATSHSLQTTKACTDTLFPDVSRASIFTIPADASRRPR
jgi:hypothetical protein